jgi:WD40 repeat protein
MTLTAVPVAQRDSPYFGLDYYDEKFGAWFFGRESDGSKIITNLRAARLTLLHAESGVGKTSLLRAGVAWRLHRLADDTFARGRAVRSIPVVFSSWKDDPATELAVAVGAAVRPYLADGRVPARASGPLDEVIAAAADAAGAGLLIMLDQFEEYFLYRSREPVPERFADELARCVNRTDLRANFLIAIREDAYAGLGDLFKGRIANVYGNYLHIDFLDRASAEKAIREPLEVYNRQPGAGEPVSVQDELVEAVLDEVRAFGGDADAPIPVAIPVATANGHRDQIATPLLQLVMQSVWDTERAEGSRQLRLSTLQQLRGVRTIVDGHLGQALGALSSAERQTAIDMFDHLVTPSGGKIAESVFDLAKRTGHAEEQVDGVLRKLDDQRIVRPVPAAPGQDPVRFRRYEIFHDVLAPTINRAIAASEEQRRVRRFRRLAALAVALLVIVAAVAVVFAYLLNSANTEKLTAESRQLAAEADQQLTHDPQLSAALALQALHVHTTGAAEDALRAALPALQTIRTFDDGSTVISAAFDPADPDKVVSADYSGVAPMWDVRTGQRLARLSSGGFKKTGNANAVAFNTAGTQVAVGYTSGTVSLFDPRDGKKLESALIDPAGVYNIAFVAGTDEYVMVTGHKVVLWHSRPGATCCQVLSNDLAYTVAVDPRDTHKFVIAEQGGAFIVNTARPGQPREVRLGTVMPHDAEFSPDGSEVVTADSDGTVSVLRLATGKVIATFTSSDTNADVASFSPDGKRVVAGYLTGTARVWDVTSKLQLTLLTGHGAGISTAEFSPDGREVVTSSQDGTVRVWYAEPQELRTEFTVPPNSPAAVPLNWIDYIGNRIIAYDPYGNNYLLTPSGTVQQDLNTATFAVAMSSNRAATKIVSVDYNGQVKLWHATGSGTFRASTVQVAPASDTVMSPDGSRFAVVAGNGLTVQLRNADTGALLRTLTANNRIEDLAFDPASDQIVGVDASGQLEVWKGAASKARSLGTPGPVLLGILFDRSGSRFVTGAATGDVTVWSGSDDRVLRAINACPTPSGAELSPDGSKVVVSCSDGTARVFSADTGRALTVLQASTEQGRVSGASFSPDGNSIVTSVDASANGYIEVWNAELANASLPALERIGEQRVTLKLTPARVQQYLNGTGG